jgi:hypothetical protein
LLNKTAAEIKTAIEQIEAMTLAPDDFAEFIQEAKAAQIETHAALMVLHSQQVDHEAEQARIIAEREELARLRKQDEDRKAEERRIEAEAKAKADAEAAEIRKAQEAEAARIAAAQRELDERQRKIDEEEARQQREAEAKAKAAQDEADAKAKAKNGRGKKLVNPLAELEAAIGAGMPISAALKTAYEIGYEDGIKAAQRAA